MPQQLTKHSQFFLTFEDQRLRVIITHFAEFASPIRFILHLYIPRKLSYLIIPTTSYPDINPMLNFQLLRL